MRLLAAAVLAFSFVTTAFAANFPPNFDQTSWNKLIQKIVADGEKNEYWDGSELRTFSRIVPDNIQIPHTADYMSTIGVYDLDGKYVPIEITVVSENWAINADDNWDIEQRTYRLTFWGELINLSHSRLVETRDRYIVSIENFPIGGPDSPEELAIWGKKLAEWLQ